MHETEQKIRKFTFTSTIRYGQTAKTIKFVTNDFYFRKSLAKSQMICINSVRYRFIDSKWVNEWMERVTDRMNGWIALYIFMHSHSSSKHYILKLFFTFHFFSFFFFNFTIFSVQFYFTSHKHTHTTVVSRWINYKTQEKLTQEKLTQEASK